MYFDFLHIILTVSAEFPKKVIENDGRKLARHIKNRGRPTEQTWQKYREFRRQRNVLAGKKIKYNIYNSFFKGHFK